LVPKAPQTKTGYLPKQTNAVMNTNKSILIVVVIIGLVCLTGNTSSKADAATNTVDGITVTTPQTPAPNDISVAGVKVPRTSRPSEKFFFNRVIFYPHNSPPREWINVSDLSVFSNHSTVVFTTSDGLRVKIRGEYVVEEQK
jgi:hypothetical protein